MHTGMRIIRAIVAGERDPEVLAAFRDIRCHSSIEVIKAALVGNDRAEHIFALTQSLDLYDFYQTKIEDCDRKLEAAVAALTVRADGDVPALPKARTKRKQVNAPSFDVRAALYGVLGTDLTQIHGLGPSLALKLIAECGTDLHAWKSAKHFTSWLCLAPGNKISGGKLLSSRTRRSSSRTIFYETMGDTHMRAGHLPHGHFGTQQSLEGRASDGGAGMLASINNQRPRGAALSSGSDLYSDQMFGMARQGFVQIGPVQPLLRRLDTGEYLWRDERQCLGRDGQEPTACRKNGFCTVATVAKLRPRQVLIGRQTKVRTAQIVIRPTQVEGIQDHNAAWKTSSTHSVQRLDDFGFSQLPQDPVRPRVRMDLKGRRAHLTRLAKQRLASDDIVRCAGIKRLRVKRKVGAGQRLNSPGRRLLAADHDNGLAVCEGIDSARGPEMSPVHPGAEQVITTVAAARFDFDGER